MPLFVQQQITNALYATIIVVYIEMLVPYVPPGILNVPPEALIVPHLITVTVYTLIPHHDTPFNQQNMFLKLKNTV